MDDKRIISGFNDSESIEEMNRRHLQAALAMQAVAMQGLLLHVRNDKSLRLEPRPRFRQGKVYFVFVLPRILRLAGREMPPQFFLQIARVKLCLVPFLQEEEDH
jgi:hypothetical protein